MSTIPDPTTTEWVPIWNPNAGQTPWVSSIDGGGFDLTNAEYLFAQDIICGYKDFNSTGPATLMGPGTFTWYGPNGNFQGRFNMVLNGAESGANSGSNFWIYRYNDDSSPNGTVLTINRATAVVDFTVGPTVNGVPIPLTAPPQTPWTSDHDAAGHNLKNVANVSGTGPGTGSLTVAGGPTSGEIIIGDAIEFYPNTYVFVYNAKLGVNKVNPTYHVDVVGDCNVTGVYRINGVPQSQTPWLSDIDGAGHWAQNLGGVRIGTSSSTTALLAVFGGRSVFFPNSDPYGIYVAYNQSVNGYFIGGSSDNALVFSDPSGTERMRLTPSGQLGIGKTPAYALDVSGDVNCSGAFKINGVVHLERAPGIAPPLAPLHVSGQAQLAGWSAIFDDPSSPQWLLIGASSGVPAIQGSDPDGNTSPITLNPEGNNVGVGTAVPAYPLDVVGDVNCTGKVRVNGVPLAPFVTIVSYRGDTSTTSASDPGTGMMRWNALAAADVTELYFDRLTTDNNVDATLMWVVANPVRLLIQDAELALNYQYWTITGPLTERPDWFVVPVRFESGGGTGADLFAKPPKPIRLIVYLLNY